MISRRRLLVSAAAMVGGPALARFAPKNLILGTGSHRYEWVPDWLTPPEGLLFGDTHGLAQDRAGRIYLAHTVHADSKRSEAVCVYGPDGRFQTAWGEAFRGGAHGLDIREENGDEFLYHCDIRRRRVVKTRLSGSVVWEVGVPDASGKYQNGEPFVPTNVAFGPDGTVFVADGYGSNWIHRLDSEGNYLGTFGGPGKEPGQLVQPHGLCVDERGKDPVLLVADRGNRRIQVFDLDGKHLRFATGAMRLPCHFNLRGDLAVVPDLESVITLLDPELKPVAALGDGAPTKLRDRPKSDFLPGKFIHPHDAIFLRNGDILVAEWVPIGRVTLLKKVK